MGLVKAAGQMLVISEDEEEGADRDLAFDAGPSAEAEVAFAPETQYTDPFATVPDPSADPFAQAIGPYETPPGYGPPHPGAAPPPGFPPHPGMGPPPGYPPHPGMGPPPGYPPHPGMGPPPGYPPHPGMGPPPGYGPPPAPLGDFADLEPMELDPGPQPPGSDTEPFDGPISLDDLM